MTSKYVARIDQPDAATRQTTVISGKTVEEVGFGKIEEEQSRLDKLKIALVDGQRIKKAVTSTNGEIERICPKITDLDLSRNLFEDLGEVKEICGQLKDLKTLRLK